MNTVAGIVALINPAQKGTLLAAIVVLVLVLAVTRVAAMVPAVSKE